MNTDVNGYHEKLDKSAAKICQTLYDVIASELSDAENKVWHGHPVWFLDGNPIVGYSVEKSGVRLMFWSGQSFDEPGLSVVGKKFKDASVFYNSIKEINTDDLQRWLAKSRTVQWDYKHIVRRRGRLERIS